MVYLKNIFFVFLSFNAIYSLINLNDKNKPLKLTGSFEELDLIMSHSEFSKAWEKVRTSIKNEEINPELQKEFEDIKPEELKNKENLDNTQIDDDILLGSSNSDSCLLSKEETTDILRNKYDIIDDNPKDEIRFIVGKCHPVVLIPGMLSTKLQVRINCAKVYQEEREIFKNIRLYCEKSVCPFDDSPYEEYDLFISGLGPFQLLLLGDLNKYSACLGYFVSFFNTKDACSPDEDKGQDKYVCNYSKYIKIGYYGSTQDTKNQGQCGLKAIYDVIMLGDPITEKNMNKGITRSYGPLIERLEQRGYKPGFSLGGIPNDYRKFIATNTFTENAIRYQIETLYRNTGKKVVIIGHSFGTNTMYGNLIKEENSDLLPYIKKFIAVGPPLAGSTGLISNFFASESHYSMDFDFNGLKLKAELNLFGFKMITNILPIVMELRPLTIIGELLNNNYEYKDFGEAIKERLHLEKECGEKECKDSYINLNSKKFDKLFKGYYPSLTENICKYESSLIKTTGYYSRKCLSEMYNIAECPTLIEENRNENGKLPNDFEKYCGKMDNNLYFQQECGNNNGKNCLDEVYYTKNKYLYEETNEKAQYFIDNWLDLKYDKEYGDIDFSFYPSRETFLSAPRKQIEYYKQISLNQYLITPQVDIDIVYSSYNPTSSAYIHDKNDYFSKAQAYDRGGDGTVPSWSPIITGLKWIYDIKKYNYNNKIRLVEFCSRLGKNSEYAFDPNIDQNFVALSCDCIDNNNLYQNENSCDHGTMIADSHFFNYIFNVIEDPREEDVITNDRIMAIYNAYTFDTKKDYESICNAELLNLLDSDV